jgi:predicted dehydrogenase/aryl-alcohol dehydrogenase-like predicted oxidoreductase
MKNKISWGIIGTGAIAGVMARALSASQTGRLVAVGSRSAEAAAKFVAAFPAPHQHASYEALLADPDVQAVYVSTPHPFHAEWAIKAAEAGKHVLGEKPFALNHAEAMAVVEAAIANKVFLMEAFMYRCHPQTARLVDLIRSGVIGEVRVIQATFSFQCGFHPTNRLFSHALAGGGILDVGCYPVSLVRLVAGAATGQPFADPIEVKGVAQLGQTGVDEWAVGSFKFAGGILAQVATGVVLSQENVVRVFGSTGRLIIPNPWLANRQTAEPSKIIVQRSGGAAEEILIEADRTSFAYEVDVVGGAIAAGQQQAPPPAMTWDDTLGNLKTLDRWRESVGLIYDSEKPENCRQTVARRSLAVRQPTTMNYGPVAGITLPVSRLVLGCDNQTAMPHAAVMFDDFFTRGGNTFDTAWIYGGGRQERLLGEWLKNRGLRQEVVVIAKGAHTPYCDPVNLSRQLLESLDRLQTRYADLYLIHRDNPDIPVGEFVDALNDHLHAGRVRAFGASNWSLARVQAANRYAKRKGLTGFAAVSNNFSLARMVEPVWPGCMAASDAASRRWFQKSQTPLFAWSSQARGFFTVGDPQNTADKSLVKCWYSEDNFQRLARVKELAAQRGVTPLNIALAYVLHQPFPTFALIGPRTLAETRTSWPGLTVALSLKELRWLNLEI